jgi:putative molybdopterin biosynthesis protein
MVGESFYLHDVPLEEAWRRFTEALQTEGIWEPLDSEIISIEQALGRITAEAVWAQISSPHYHASAMDGFAVHSSDTAGATDRSPVILQVGTQASYLDTGDPLPASADAVIPIEQVEPIDASEDRDSWKAIRIRSAFSPWSHVRPMGEDIVATELVLPAGHQLRPVDLGALAGSGNYQIKVRRKPRVAILPTGSELIPLGEHPKRGQIIEYNSLVMASQVEQWGGAPTRLPLVADNFEDIKKVVSQASEKCDLLLINAGSSAGSEDFTAQVVSSLGELIVHGVAVRPGHPVILGMIDCPAKSERKNGNRRIPVIGVPGYPVSAALTGEIFVAPLISEWLGRPHPEPTTITAVITRKVHSSMGDDEYLRVTVGRVGDRIIAAPLSRGAGTITSLVRADGIVQIPSGIQGLQAGEDVKVQLYRSEEEINRTIMVLGSHDLTIDLLAQQLALSGTRLTSANVGSLGGLIALNRNEAHLAGSHLLDPESGDYNLKYIHEYMPGIPTRVIALVEREQGLLIFKENPKGIEGLHDLLRDDIHFVNRQRGSGTRLLLDYHLERLGLDPNSIQGYSWEEFTHLTIAAAIAAGRADCGLGIRGAATALDLDFIPLFSERYDLVIPEKFYESALMKPLIDLLNDQEFHQAVDLLPGYSAKVMGQIIAQIE